MKTGNPPECGGYVLVGGRSSRMGRDKALLPLNGLPLAEKIARQIEIFAQSVSLIGDPEQYGQLGRRVIPDHFPGCGPLAGIHAALLDSSQDWNLIAACDMPSIEIGLIGALLTLDRSDADCVLPLDADGRRQPLLALYHRRCLPAIEAALNSGDYKVLRALVPVRIREIPAADETFRNLNTFEEWSAFLKSHV
jgi:molybdopterin-guanine dinucleotide biosynthesis protein A